MFEITEYSEKLGCLLRRSDEEVIVGDECYGNILNVYFVELFGNLEDIVFEMLINVNDEYHSIKYFRFPVEAWLDHETNGFLDDLREYLKENHLRLKDFIGKSGTIITENEKSDIGYDTSIIKRFIPRLETGIKFDEDCFVFEENLYAK